MCGMNTASRCEGNQFGKGTTSGVPLVLRIKPASAAEVRCSRQR